MEPPLPAFPRTPLLCLVFLPLFLPALRSSPSPTLPMARGRIELFKCCFMSEYLKIDGLQCVTEPWSNPNFTWYANLDPPVVDRWVPPPLRNHSIHASYRKGWWGDELAILNADNATLLAEVLSAKWSDGVFAALELFNPPVDESAAWAQSFCFDYTGDPSFPNVLVTGLLIRSISKCCPDGQRLNALAVGCEETAGFGDESGDGSGAGRGGGDLVGSRGAKGDGEGVNGVDGVDGVDGVEGVDGGNGGDGWGSGGGEGSEGGKGGGGDEGSGSGESDEVVGSSWGGSVGDESVGDGGGGVAVADWRPPSSLAYARGLRSDVIPVWDWNVAVPATEESDAWQLLARSGVQNMRVWVRGPQLEGETDAFCFDAVAEGPLAPRALLALVAHAPKCCGRGQRLSVDAQSCEGGQAVVGEGAAAATVGGEAGASEASESSGSSGASGTLGAADETGTTAEAGAGLEGSVSEGALQSWEGRVGEENALASPWLPPALATRLNLSSSARVVVQYNASWGLKMAVLLDADDSDAWSVEPEKGWGVQFVRGLRLTQLAPGAVQRWCVDARAGGGRVLAAEVSCDAAGVRCVPKCCPSGRLLLADGRCGAASGAAPARDWDPMRSAAAALLAGPGERAVARFDWDLPCETRVLGPVAPPPEEVAARLNSPEEWRSFSNVYHCADFLLDEGKTREVLASCVLPGVAGVYVRVRPLQALAVVLLALGIASLLGQDNTRRTVHGWALASHAACLLAANALQVTWFFTHERNSSCQNYAFAIYYFLVAAGVWLNVVSLNIVRGFRQPLGARSSGGAGNHSRALMRQLAAWSAYGWGCPAVFTAVAVYMFWDRQKVEQAGYASPTFFETRTCLLEDRLFSYTKDEGRKNVGAIFYYYIPMSVLVVVNAACLAYTIIIVWKWKKATAMVHNIGSSTGANKGGLQDALLYVKLLLTAGVAELVLEVAVWATRPTEWENDFWLIRYNSIMHSIYVFNMAATLVDVLRALAVLWLSVGRCASTAQKVRRALRRLRDRVRPRSRDLPQAQRFDSDWASADTTTTTTTTGC